MSQVAMTQRARYQQTAISRLQFLDARRDKQPTAKVNFFLSNERPQSTILKCQPRETEEVSPRIFFFQ